MNKRLILAAFKRLNDLCSQAGVKSEIGVVGGAGMLLAFNARKTTKDVDAIFEPSSFVREAAKKISHELDLPTDWLNDAVKGYLPGRSPTKREILRMDHLFVWVPPPEYMLAMKAISARFDTMDATDLKTLVAHLKLKTPEEVFHVIKKFYPRKRIPPKTQYFVEELFE